MLASAAAQRSLTDSRACWGIDTQAPLPDELSTAQVSEIDLCQGLARPWYCIKRLDLFFQGKSSRGCERKSMIKEIWHFYKITYNHCLGCAHTHTHIYIESHTFSQGHSGFL